MLRDYQKGLIFSATILLLIPIVQSRMGYPKGGHYVKESESALSDDELSYAISELSLDELSAMYRVLGEMDENDGQGSENDVAIKLVGDERNMPVRLARIKRENANTPTEEDQDNSLPNVDEEYIKQLDESFPNVVEQSNQDDKEKEHVRVKRT